MTDIVMPQLGETVTEGTITKWFKAVGDAVTVDEPLFEVSTDKVDSEVPSSATGVVAEILVAEGETVPVGARLAVVSPAGSPAASPAGAAPAPAAPVAAAPPPSPAPAAPVAAAPPPSPAPAAQQPLFASPPPPPPPPPPLPPPPPPPLPPPPPPPPPPPAVAPPAQTDTFPSPLASPESGSARSLVLSPVVRRMIADNGLDPTSIAGTGPGGRITRDDVLAVVEGRARGAVPADAVAPPTSAPVPPPTPAASSAALSAPGAPVGRPPVAVAAAIASPVRQAAVSPPAAASATARSGDEVVPFSNIRRRTAEHMVRSRQTSAHTLAVMEVDFEAVDAVRAKFGAAFAAEEGFSLTYLPFLLVATVQAIRAWPHVNASVGDDALIVHHDIHLGIAVDLEDEGLIVPVVHDADSKRLRALAREVRDLATRARSKKLGADDIAGGTFTITNPGPFGTLVTAPIINQPQVAILSTDGIARRPVAVDLPDGSEAIAIHSVGNVALSFDHRVVDGAYAARFLRELKSIIEGRDWAQEL